jgi:hypothetical protein
MILTISSPGRHIVVEVKFMLSFVAWTTGTRRHGRKSGWRLCSFEKILSRKEAANALAAYRAGHKIRIAAIEFVQASDPVRIGVTTTYVFKLADANQVMRIHGHLWFVPVLSGGVELRDILRQLKKAGYKKAIISELIEGAPAPYHPSY